jgi:hypothetical protein
MPAWPEIIDAVILPVGLGARYGRDFIANLGLPDLHYTPRSGDDGAMCVSALECATTALASGIAIRADRSVAGFYRGARPAQEF